MNGFVLLHYLQKGKDHTLIIATLRFSGVMEKVVIVVSEQIMIMERKGNGANVTQ